MDDEILCVLASPEFGDGQSGVLFTPDECIDLGEQLGNMLRSGDLASGAVLTLKVMPYTQEELDGMPEL